ncbi:hypothetical protein ID866_7991 [Astraeus odoratus]|nr:hypothetical protein ID866_7991 [Astraeus odoratus]
MCMQSKYQSQGTLGDLEGAIAIHQQALDLQAIGHPNRSSSLANLAICMQYRYEAQGALIDLKEAISFHQQALDLRPVGHPSRPSSLVNLANCMQSRYESQGALEDLEEAISLHQQALDLSPVSHPNRSSLLANLAICMKSRYKSQHALGDLDKAISLHKQSLDLCPVGHPNRPSSLSNLASCMQSRYHSQGGLEDLEEAISLHQQALDLFSAGHANRISCIDNLANCLQSRYQSQGALEDLEKAISLHQQALDLFPVNHPNRSSSMANLANCMQSRYQSQGRLTDLEEAISFQQQALDLCPVGHPNRTSFIASLANCKQSRYEIEGDLADLEQAMSLHQQALGLCPAGHPNRSSSLARLAICMQSRYESQGALEDLEEAISLHQEALELFPVGHPQKLSSLVNLASCMQSRYELQGALGDLEEAISFHQQALDLCSDHHPNRSLSLASLACCMQSRYQSQGALGNQNRTSSLVNLANCIQSRYQSQGTLENLDEAISLYQQALHLFPVGHPKRSSPLINLANCMQSRYQSQEALRDLEEAISLQKQALDLCHVGHPNRSSALANLASCMQSRYESKGTLADLEESSFIVPDTHQLIKNVMHDILHDIPPRLLQTNTGLLLTQAHMITHFCDSTQYQMLVKLLEKSNDWYLNVNHMQATISAYFQYSTLSHRWGPNEPLLQDIPSHGSIYNMSPTQGVVKLQRFCQTASHHGFSWAWSDTCCIDKTNSVELQKAIGSMFLWYQKSALTIVYLADIPSSISPVMSLSGSEWFRRGWTLQELLAPHTMLFYTQDWSLYMNSISQNHKQDDHVLNQIAHAAGISPEHLSNFIAGTDIARSRLEWASGRHTTVSEDIAYSLFGIFNINLPLLYGEGKEKSLVRLLQEILSQSHDISILYWVGEQSSRHSCFPANISSYQPLPRVRSDLTGLSVQQSIESLQYLLSRDDANKVYNIFANLPCAKFTDYILSLPCIVHSVQAVKLGHTYMDCHTYDVQAMGLRPVQIITSEYLMQSMDPTKLPYVLIRPWDRRLLNYLEEDHVMAGYEALMELGRPFIALMLLRLPEGEYKRICASRFIVVCADDPASIVSSETAILDIV